MYIHKEYSLQELFLITLLHHFPVEFQVGAQSGWMFQCNWVFSPGACMKIKNCSLCLHLMGGTLPSDTGT